MPPYKWNVLSDRFDKIGVHFRELKGLDGTNEARVINNKIKHTGVVDAELAAFPRFNNLLGKQMDTINLNLQYYADCAFEFVGHLQESADGILQ